MYKRMAPLFLPAQAQIPFHLPMRNSVLTTLFFQCSGPPTLLLHQERRIRRNPLLADRRPLLPLQLEYQASLRVRVSLMAECDIHGAG